MESRQVVQLIEEIRAGRKEDGSVEWKRAFWRLDQDASRREFFKDITGIANSTDPTQVRRILIGVATTGQLHSSKLFHDEADLQQLLSAITPKPTVRFETHDIEGTPLVLVEIHPPFDRPYVARVGDVYYIWIRHGSTIGTASRYDLDRFYRDQMPQPTLSVNWIDKDEREMAVLELPATPDVDLEVVQDGLRKAQPSDEELVLVQEQKEELQSAIERYGTKALHLGEGLERAKPELLVELPRELAKEIDNALRALAFRPTELGFRYEMISRSRRLLLKVRNEGTAPAEDVVIHLYSTDKVRFLSYKALHDEALPIPPAFVHRARALINLAAKLAEDSNALDYLNKPLLFAARLAPPSWYDGLVPHLPAFDRSSDLRPPVGAYQLYAGRSLPHGFSLALANDDGEGGFVVGNLKAGEESTVSYSIHADNLPVPTRGELKVRGITVPAPTEK